MIKRPKIYLRDSGLFHLLQAIETEDQLLSHHKLGASWKGFALECAANILKKKTRSLFFWQTHSGASVDLFWQKRGKNWGIEFKFSYAPTLTKSMQIAIHDLKLSHLWVIYPGDSEYLLDKNISVLPVTKLEDEKIFSQSAG